MNREIKFLLIILILLISLVFFYFNTQMHKRYSHPALLFSGAFAFVNGSYLMYVLCSLAYFLNMEKVLKYLQLENYNTFIFDERVISVLYLTAIILGICLLYKAYFTSKPDNIIA